MHKINTKSNTTMKMTKLAGYILLAVLATALWKCKDEDNGGAQPFGAPKAEIIISGGLTTFNYGDTLFIDAHTTENDKYVYQVKLYFDNEELLSTRKNLLMKSIPSGWKPGSIP
jgi:hypothetical protein